MRILLIKLKHIGDSLLLTATTRTLRECYPHAEISVLVRQGSEGILAGAESIDNVYTCMPAELERRGFHAWIGECRSICELQKKRFDVVVELTRGDRGRWRALLVRSKTKASYAAPSGNWFWRSIFDVYGVPFNKEEHAVWKDFRLVRHCLGLEDKSPSPLEFVPEQDDVVMDLPENFILFHPSTRWKRKRWPAKSWGELARRLSEKGTYIVLSSGPDDREREFCRQIESHAGGVKLNYTGGRLTWAQLAGVMRRAQLFVGVDTAAMHLAAACQVPIISLFLPWMSMKWHPWKVDHDILQSAEFAKDSHSGDPSLQTCMKAMDSISVSSVVNAAEKRLKGAHADG